MASLSSSNYVRFKVSNKDSREDTQKKWIYTLKYPIVAVQGGLGNQLSQWYFAHSITRDSYFRIDPLHNFSEQELRSFELSPLISVCPHNQFQAQNRFIFRIEKSYYRSLNKLWEFKVLQRLVESLGYFREDPRFDQVQSKNNPNRVRYARGYFQKQSEIEKIFDCVRKEMFPLIEASTTEIRSKFELTSEYTVIHVRRGDYSAKDFTPVHIGTLSDEYFLKASETLKKSKVLVLTENREDVKTLARKLGTCTVLDKSDTSPWETLAIMAGASQFLGSNSSLSWWGARLSYALGGQVWLPEQWSYWKNIDPSDYHFPGSQTKTAFWIEDSSQSM